MKYARIILFLMLYSICVYSVNIYAQNGAEKISVEVNYLPQKVEKGDMPIALTSELLKELFPELDKPRQMLLKDLKDIVHQSIFIKEGLSFVLRGDFNKDGIGDVVFGGKYISGSFGEQSFIAVITFRENSVVREFMKKFHHNEDIILSTIYSSMPFVDGVLITFALESDHQAILCWTGSEYKIGPSPWEIK